MKGGVRGGKKSRVCNGYRLRRSGFSRLSQGRAPHGAGWALEDSSRGKRRGPQARVAASMAGAVSFSRLAEVGVSMAGGKGTSQ